MSRALRVLRRAGGATQLVAALGTLRGDLAGFVAAIEAQRPRSARMRRGQQKLLRAIHLYQRGAAGLSRSLALAANHHRAAARRTLNHSVGSLRRADRQFTLAAGAIRG